MALDIANTLITIKESLLKAYAGSAQNIEIVNTAIAWDKLTTEIEGLATYPESWNGENIAVFFGSWAAYNTFKQALTTGNMPMVFNLLQGTCSQIIKDTVETIEKEQEEGKTPEFQETFESFIIKKSTNKFSDVLATLNGNPTLESYLAVINKMLAKFKLGEFDYWQDDAGHQTIEGQYTLWVNKPTESNYWDNIGDAIINNVNDVNIDPSYVPPRYKDENERKLVKSQGFYDDLLTVMNGYLKTYLFDNWEAPLTEEYKKQVRSFVTKIKELKFSEITDDEQGLKNLISTSNDNFIEGSITAYLIPYIKFDMDALNDLYNQSRIDAFYVMFKDIYDEHLVNADWDSFENICYKTGKGCDSVIETWTDYIYGEIANYPVAQQENMYAALRKLKADLFAASSHSLLDDAIDLTEGAWDPLDNSLTNMFADIIKFAAISAVVLVGGFIGFKMFLEPYLKKRAIKSEIKDQIETDRLRANAGLQVNTAPPAHGMVPVTPIAPDPTLRTRLVNVLPGPAGVAIKTIKGDEN